jgi:hypothetical protein
MSKELVISENFTVEDIRKIRDYHYFRRIEIGEEAFDKEVKMVVAEFLKKYPNIKVVKSRPTEDDDN